MFWGYFDPDKNFLDNEKICIFRGDLTDISAKQEPLAKPIVMFCRGQVPAPTFGTDTLLYAVNKLLLMYCFGRRDEYLFLLNMTLFSRSSKYPIHFFVYFEV